MWYLCMGNDGSDLFESDNYPLSVNNGGKYFSIAGGYATKELLIEKNKVPKDPCKECGGEFSTHYIDNKMMIERNLCFVCNLWTNEIERTKLKNVVVINNGVYTISKDNPNSTMKGYGGREFKIKKFGSDEIIITRNLWHQGKVPKRFQDRIENNAEFIKENLEIKI